MADFWEQDTPASGDAKASGSEDAFWTQDKEAAQQELPAGVKASTEGGGRGSVNPPTVADRGEDLSKPAFRTPAAVSARQPAPKKAGSVLEDVVLDEPTVTPAQQAENARLSNRAYAERTPQVTDALPRQHVSQGSFQPTDSKVEGLGLNTGDLPAPARFVGKAVGQGVEALGGITRLAGDLSGSKAVSDFGANAANNAQKFQDAIGKPNTGTDFNPRGPVPYLADQAESTAASLASSYGIARSFGARAVIPMMTLQDAAQYYNQGKNAGLDTGTALMLAIPHGIFEAIGEKYAGFDKAMGAMQVILTRGAPKQALQSASKILLENGIREVPGEVLTYVGQSGIDKLNINKDMTMEQWLQGLQDTVVQAGMMGLTTGGAGAVAHLRAQASKPREKGAEELAREKGFLVREEQAKRLATAGDKEVAAGLQRQVDSERAGLELNALQDQPWAQGDVFAQRYQQLRTEGKKPAEAAARAAMANAYAQIGSHLGLNENAFRKAADAAATMPMDQVPGFFERVTANLVKKGMSQPVAEGAIGGAVSGARDAAVAGAMTQVYGEEPPTETVKGILDLEAQQDGGTPDGTPSTESVPASPQAAPALGAAGTPTGTAAGTPEASRETDGHTRPGRSPLHPDDLTPNEAGAHAGASSPLNDKTATPAQILAGNAPLGHMKVGGLGFSVENAVGSERRDLKNEPPKWVTPMAHGYHYGYFKRTEGADGDHVDAFVAEGTTEDYDGPVFVVDQASRNGSFDEHKAVIGPSTEKQAREAYLAHYEKGWTGLGAISEMSMPEFRKWVRDGKKTQPVNPQAFEEAAAVDAAAKAGSQGAGADAAAGAAGADAGGGAAAVAPLRLGITPNDAVPVTVRNGVVHIGNDPAVNFDSGEDVTAADDATPEQIKKALKDAGAVSRRMKFFGGAKEAAAEAAGAEAPETQALPEDPQAMQRTVIELRKDVAVLRKIRDCVAKGIRR